nr:zinc finger C2H2 type [Hymenolepis microstoma]
MGRKKRKLIKPWCWYCNRDFEDEKILIHHQKAKHFKCPFCHRKLFTGPGLSIHCNAVHKEKIDKIPNALPHRSSMVIDIYGMAGIPEADLLEHERQKLGLDSTGEDEPPEKMVRAEEPSTSFAAPPPPPIPFPFVPPVAGMMPYVPPAVPGGVQPFLPSGVIPAPPPPPPPPNSESSTSNPEISTTEAPTFPAYSEAEIAKNSAPKVVRPVSGVNGIEVHLIYPEEDLSLEELMAARPKYQEILKTALQPQPLQPALQNPGFIPPYMQLPRGVPATTTGIPLMPVQQPLYGMPGYPQTPWMGLPNVRF